MYAITEASIEIKFGKPRVPRRAAKEGSYALTGGNVPGHLWESQTLGKHIFSIWGYLLQKAADLPLKPPGPRI